MITLSTAFKRAKDEQRLAIIGYLPAGYPDPVTFVDLVHHAFNAGLDILEIGLPNHDARYDGEIIRTAMQHVISQGIDTRQALDLAAEAIQDAPGAGLLMFYADDLVRLHPFELLEICRQAGISGVLPVGMDLIAWQSFAKAALARDISPVGFITIEMDEIEMQKVIESSAGFLYLQSHNAPTGYPGEFGEELAGRLGNVKLLSRANPLPIAVGFGVRQHDDVERIRSMGADGVIVGTAFLEAATQGKHAIESLLHDLSAAAKFVYA